MADAIIERDEIKKEPLPTYIKTVYSKEWLMLLLLAISTFSAVASATAYVSVVIGTLVTDVWLTVKFVLVTAIPFILVSIVRRIINAPRPRELYDFSELGEAVPKKVGRSFPSRHVFSACVIGSSICFIQPILGAVVLILGIALGACRVLMGHHFVRDVVTGGAVGIVCGIVGMLIVNLG